MANWPALAPAMYVSDDLRYGAAFAAKKKNFFSLAVISVQCYRNKCIEQVQKN